MNFRRFCSRTRAPQRRALAACLALGMALQPSHLPAQNLPDLGDSSRSALSASQERAIGKEIMGKLRTDNNYMDDPEALDYINRLGGKLLAANPEGRQDFEFFVMRDTSLNAFALPGGYIGVHTGLVTAAENESELASVLAHEIAHVTQHHIARLVQGSQASALTTLAAVAVAILAARSNSQASQAAIAAAQASAIQSQLDFTREHEREADRIGLHTLTQAGFDARAMRSFFERLQRYSRPYESNAPSYLRTHPVTTERIADVENRLAQVPYRQVVDNLEFQLIRARLRAFSLAPREAVKLFDSAPAEKTPIALAAHAYGQALALYRANDLARADETLAPARKQSSALIESLAARIKLGLGQKAEALALYRDAVKRFPDARALNYGYIEALLSDRRSDAALKLVNDRLQLTSGDAHLHELQARCYAALGQRFRQHRAQAEAYAQRGQLGAAIEQLQLALRARDGDFYETSNAEARLKELQSALQAERKSQPNARAN
jgi:predicted Zn-dependent protease